MFAPNRSSNALSMSEELNIAIANFLASRRRGAVDVELVVFPIFARDGTAVYRLAIEVDAQGMAHVGESAEMNRVRSR